MVPSCSRVKRTGGVAPTLISSGGGVFPRTAKSIEVAPQVRAVLGINVDRVEAIGWALATSLAALAVYLLPRGFAGTDWRGLLTRRTQEKSA